MQGGQWKTRSPVVWFLAVDSKGKSRTGAPFEWRAPFHIEATLASRPSGVELTVEVVPRGSEVLVTFDGRNPKDGAAYTGPMSIPPAAVLIRISSRRRSVPGPPRRQFRCRSQAPVLRPRSGAADPRAARSRTRHPDEAPEDNLDRRDLPLH